MFSGCDQHVLSIPHWTHHFLAIFSKVHDFVQNSLFSSWSTRFVIFPSGHQFSATFSKVDQIVQRSIFSHRDQHLLSFSHCTHYFLAVMSKVHKFVQNSVFSPREARFPIFAPGTNFLAVFSKVLNFVQNSVFSLRSARFVIFKLSAPLFSNFQQSTRVCSKLRFQREISTFSHFGTGHNTF